MIQANFESGTVVWVVTNRPNAGQSVVWLRGNHSPLSHNEFENGTLQISGQTPTFKVLANQSELMRGADVAIYADFIVVDGLPENPTNHPSFVLRDDDERWVVTAALPQLPMDGYSQQFINGFTPSLTSKRIYGIAETYAPAFIAVADANQLGWNARANIPFLLNRDVFDVLYSGVFDDAKDLTDTSVFCADTVTFGFQPDASEDGNPDIEHGFLARFLASRLKLRARPQLSATASYTRSPLQIMQSSIRAVTAQIRLRTNAAIMRGCWEPVRTKLVMRRANTVKPPIIMKVT